MSNNIITIEGSPKEIAEFCNSLDINKYSLSIKLNNKTIDEVRAGFDPILQKIGDLIHIWDLLKKFTINHLYFFKI